MAKTVIDFQIPSKSANRRDHVWMHTGVKWKCVLCGAITGGRPPRYPTRTDWMPERYEHLTKEERHEGRNLSE